VSAPFLFKFSVQDFRPTLPGQAGFVQTVSEKRPSLCDRVTYGTVIEQLYGTSTFHRDTTSGSSQGFFNIFDKNNKSGRSENPGTRLELREKSEP
jgi:hypothetical protein